jgi:hypothetical protein
MRSLGANVDMESGHECGCGRGVQAQACGQEPVVSEVDTTIY